MVRKNKLYKHHKSKAVFYIKNFSFALIGLIGVASALTIPTYIATIRNEEITIKAESNESNKDNDEAKEDAKEESEELLAY